jgi:hypothetical protein
MGLFSYALATYSCGWLFFAWETPRPRGSNRGFNRGSNKRFRALFAAFLSTQEFDKLLINIKLLALAGIEAIMRDATEVTSKDGE